MTTCGVRLTFRLDVVPNLDPPPGRLAFLTPLDAPGQDLRPADEILVGLRDLLAPADGEHVQLIVHAFTVNRAQKEV